MQDLFSWHVHHGKRASCNSLSAELILILPSSHIHANLKGTSFSQDLARAALTHTSWKPMAMNETLWRARLREKIPKPVLTLMKLNRDTKPWAQQLNAFYSTNLIANPVFSSSGISVSRGLGESLLLLPSSLFVRNVSSWSALNNIFLRSCYTHWCIVSHKISQVAFFCPSHFNQKGDALKARSLTECISAWEKTSTAPFGSHSHNGSVTLRHVLHTMKNIFCPRSLVWSATLMPVPPGTKLQWFQRSAVNTQYLWSLQFRYLSTVSYHKSSNTWYRCYITLCEIKCMVCTAVKDEAGMVGGWKVQWNCWQVDKAGVGEKVQPLARSCGGDRKMKVLTLTTPQWTLPEASQVYSYSEARRTLVFSVIMVHSHILCSWRYINSHLQYWWWWTRAERCASVQIFWENFWGSWPTPAAWQTFNKSWPLAWSHVAVSMNYKSLIVFSEASRATVFEVS